MVVRQQINQHAPRNSRNPRNPGEPSIRGVDRRRRWRRFGLFYALPLAETGARPTRLNVRISLWHTSDMNRLPPTFEHYCQAMLHHSEAHGYRLTDAGGFIANLNSSSLHGGDCTLPLNEGQIRPLLAVVPKANQVECWHKIVEAHDVTNLTGPMVEREVNAYVRKEGLESTKKPKPPKPDVWAKAIRGVVSLQAVIHKLPNPDRFNPLIQDILVLLKGGMAGDKVVEVQAVAVEPETTMDGTTAPEIPDQVPVAASSETTTPPGRKANVSKVGKRAVKVAGVEPPPSLPAGEQQTI
jgi:hypothetical protein